MNHVSGEWGIVCADWVNHPEVGPDELALLALLSLYAAKDGTCWPSQSTLADRLKRSRSWVIRVLNILEATGLVTRSQRQAARGRRATCLYTLVGHAEAVKGTPLVRSGGPVHDYHVANHRVAGMEQEHQNPAIAGLSRDPHRDSESPSVNEQAASADRRPAKGQPPEDWTPSPADRAFAAEHAPSVDVDRFARLFVESCRSHGYRYVNHSAAFRTWLLNRWEKPDAAHADRRTDRQRSRRGYPPARRQPSEIRSSANRDTALAALDLLAG
jgi:DNA-binding MarR family transcriptional regulator